MEKLLIFTNFVSLLIHEDDGRRNNNKIHLIERYKFIALKNASSLEFEQANNINEGIVFLIQDSVTDKDIVLFLNNFDTTKIAILHHRNPGDNVKNLFPYKIPSNHTPNSLYDKALNILSDDQDNKFERLKGEVFPFNNKLNPALEFLHECLGGTPSDDTQKLTSAGFGLNKNENDKPSINDLINKLSNGGDYNAALREVRDALLLEAGIY